MRNWSVIAVCGVFVLAEGTAIGVPADIRPTGKTPDCTTSGCHSSQVNRPFVHGPTSVGACEMCHEYADPAAHTFTFKHQGRNMCDFCHADKAVPQGQFVHKPVADGECIKCHDPHGSTTRALLKGTSSSALCVTCHQNVTTAAHVHRPVAEDCTLCHKAHAADHASLLTQEKSQLCAKCHEGVAHTALSAKFPHEPAKGDCLQCHTPHASDQEKILKMATTELCTSCHADVGKEARSASHPHSAVLDGKACLNCHTAHGSEHKFQLAAEPIASCLTCHAKPVVVSAQRTIEAVPEIAIDSMHKHGAINDGSCSACHTVHGGERDRLLVKNYTKAFYEPFSEEAYDLCFSCHDKKLVDSPTAEALQTNFRDGTRNLHYVHVRSSPQGRSCRSCHAIHASRFESMICDTVPYGQWKLPMNYAATATGGSCASGCHKPRTYDRTIASVVTPPPTGNILETLPPAAPGPAPAAPGSTGAKGP